MRESASWYRWVAHHEKDYTFDEFISIFILLFNAASLSSIEHVLLNKALTA